MKRHSVSSSNILSVGYDSDTRTLEIEFKGGGIYQYYGVPQNVYSSFLNAPSLGKYFHDFIKEVYSTVQVG